MLNSKNSFSLTSKLISKQAIIAAIYAVLTYLGWGFSYGPVQFRYSEILNWLAFVDPKNIIGLSLGCFISNIPSPLGIMDLFFGTLHTFIGAYFMAKSSNKFLAMVWHALFSFIIAFELFLAYGGGAKVFMETYGAIALSEFIIIGPIGLSLFSLLSMNKSILRVICDDEAQPVKDSFVFKFSKK